MYHGENREGGARFTYLFNKSDQAKPEAKENDEASNEDSEAEEDILNEDDIERIKVDEQEMFPSLCEALREMVNNWGVASSCNIFAK